MFIILSSAMIDAEVGCFSGLRRLPLVPWCLILVLYFLDTVKCWAEFCISCFSFCLFRSALINDIYLSFNWFWRSLIIPSGNSLGKLIYTWFNLISISAVVRSILLMIKLLLAFSYSLSLRCFAWSSSSSFAALAFSSSMSYQLCLFMWLTSTTSSFLV